MRNHLLLVTTLLLIAPTTGCGALVTYEDAGPERWPLRTAADAPEGEARPTVLVRRGAEADALTVRLDPSTGQLAPEPATYTRDALARALPEVVEGSGLFSEVLHQDGAEEPHHATDYTLDLALAKEVRAEWYSAFGLVPGLPLVAPIDWTLTCRVLDRDGQPLTRFDVTGTQTLVAWLPLLPLNVLLTLVPGDLGMDLGEWVASEREFVAELIRRALAEADRQVRFAATSTVLGDASSCAPPSEPR